MSIRGAGKRIPALGMMHIANPWEEGLHPHGLYRMDWRKVVPEIRANELKKNPTVPLTLRQWHSFCSCKERNGSLKTEFRLIQDSNPWPRRSWAVQHSTRWANQPTGSPEGGRRGYSGFHVTGMIEQSQKSKPKNPKGFKQTPQESLDQHLTPEKSHAEFPSHKNFQNTETVAKQLCFYFNHESITWKLSRIFRLFWIPPKNRSFNQATRKKINKIFLPKKIP